MPTTMLGVASVLAACACWSLSLVAPELTGVGATGVVAARYLGGGLPSLAWLSRRGGEVDWVRALRFAAVGQVGYYALALTAVRLAGAGLVVGIVGLTPVVMAVAERRVERRPLRPLALPLAGSFVGLVLLGARQVATARDHGTTGGLALGALLAVVGLSAWTWANIDNVRYLRANPHVSTSRWASATSVATMLVASPVILFVASRTPMAGVPPLLVIASTVGVGGSWLAVMAFAKGARLLPPGMAGQLLVVETILGVAIVAAVEGVVPDAVTVAGVVLLVLAVTSGVRRHTAGTARVAVVTGSRS